MTRRAAISPDRRRAARAEIEIAKWPAMGKLAEDTTARAARTAPAARRKDQRALRETLAFIHQIQPLGAQKGRPATR